MRSGIFFPENIKGRAGSPKDWNFESLATISDIHVNQDLPADIFRLRFPKGATLVDGIKGVSYRIDESGNPISEEKPVAKVSPPTVGDGVRPIVGTQTQEEPKSWTRWILPISLGLLVLCVIGILFRYRRNR